MRRLAKLTSRNASPSRDVVTYRLAKKPSYCRTMTRKVDRLDCSVGVRVAGREETITSSSTVYNQHQPLALCRTMDSSSVGVIRTFSSLAVSVASSVGSFDSQSIFSRSRGCSFGRAATQQPPSCMHFICQCPSWSIMIWFESCRSWIRGKSHRILMLVPTLLG